ncbi:MAG TPA: hypothetical protein EYQ00_09655 [Dehalococcoidia bacterium]|jgi:hypothetical protein|nr:hypothetical protein [Dehalococcoidia bacterium]
MSKVKGPKRLTSVWVNSENLSKAQHLARSRGVTLSALLRRFIDTLGRELESLDVAQQERFFCRSCDKDVYAEDEKCIECSTYVIPNQ